MVRICPLVALACRVAVSAQMSRTLDADVSVVDMMFAIVGGE